MRKYIDRYKDTYRIGERGNRESLMYNKDILNIFKISHFNEFMNYPFRFKQANKIKGNKE